MRTTLREKLVLWLVGLSLAASLELLLRSQISPVSPLGVAVIVPTVLILGVVAALILRYRRP
jgi:uncharacterized membrane protein AbrB (regulator of aidB expression)